MSGMKKAKCYKKSGVKVWFGRLGNADKYWLESFRDYTTIKKEVVNCKTRCSFINRNACL